MKPAISTKKAAFLVLTLLVFVVTVHGATAISTSDVYLYYSFDNANLSGSNPLDLSTNSRDGTNNGAATGSAGILNEAFLFDNTPEAGDRVESNGDWNNLDYSTVSFWFKPGLSWADSGTEQMVLYDTTRRFYAFRYGNVLEVAAGTSSGQYKTVYNNAVAPSWWNTAAWTHMVIVYHPTRLEVFANNVLIYNDTLTSTNKGTSAVFNIGNRYATTYNGFDGLIDEFLVLDYAASAADVDTLYNSGSAYNPFDDALPGGGGTNSYAVDVKDLYDLSDLDGANVTFAPGCYNTTDAGGTATVTNVSGCSTLNGTLSGVTVSKSGMTTNQSTYTVPENGTGDAGLYHGAVNITKIYRLIDGVLLGPGLGVWTVNTSGGRTYAECGGGATYPCMIYGTSSTTRATLQYTGVGEYYDFDFILNGTTGTVTTPYERNQRLSGVYNLQVTVNAYNLSSDLITTNTTINAFEEENSYNDSCSTVTGTCVFNLIQDYNYTFEIQPTGFEYLNLSLTPTADAHVLNSTHYAKNTITFYFRNQETAEFINATVYLEMISDSESANYTTDNGSLTTEVLSPDSYTLRYVAAGYSVGNYFFTIVDNYHYFLNLTLVNASNAANVTITVYDTVGNRIEGATVKILKYNLATNSYIITEILSTNFQGVTIGSIQLNSEYYKFIVEYEDFTTTTNPTYIYGTELTLYLNLYGSGFADYFNGARIAGTLSYDNNTDLTTFDYNDYDNLASGACAYAYRYSASGLTLYNSSCVSGSSGSAWVGIPNTTGVTYLVKGVVTKSGSENLADTLIIEKKSVAPENGFGMFLLIILELVVIFIGVWNLGVAIILAGAVPLLVGITGLVSLPLYATVPLFVGGLILAYLITKE